jgi:ADP-ribosylglycohydrolase
VRHRRLRRLGTGRRRTPLLLEIAQESAARATTARGGTARITEALANVAAGTWILPTDGPTMDPSETVSAVLYYIHTGQPLRQALITAIGLGGDADTVAAMVGGLLGATSTRDEVLAALPYSHQLQIPEARQVDELANGLAALRTGRNWGASHARRPSPASAAAGPQAS